ncbi:roadblock/LC7 domain-containing protein [Streptomyces justiciae]|uniref:roadblock/LC7 domain-containing protein n=1 Tax=Streptomyces justiciae TaxID=2780140 RepID=UPI0021177496|nr:roadblock/LC7 domain-containing protein [Streptomyces justiciae]MCW8379833.1 roadblock/LC7 domain-containing protein [Streptomyces justiciae]
MTDDNGGTTVIGTAPGDAAAQKKLSELLAEFVSMVPDVTHALLVSRDGMKLVDSGVSRTWADRWAATLGTLASLCENIPGPDGGKGRLQLAWIERDDALIFVSIAGTSEVFQNNPGNRDGRVDTVLAVIAKRGASVADVGYEMGQLVDRFAPYMVTAVRSL